MTLGSLASNGQHDASGDDPDGRARELDRELLRLARADSTARQVLGRLANRFIELRGYERLGFARLGDYCTERLGWSCRQFQEIARVAVALSRLPAIDRAFRRGTIGWSKARLLASVASPCDEARWLAVAACTDTRALAVLTASARAAALEVRRSFSASSPARTRAGVRNSSADDNPDAKGDQDDETDEHVFLRIACTQRARGLWGQARLLAPRLAGRALSPWEVAEFLAAEASSAPGPFQEAWQQEPWRSFAADPPASTNKRTRRSRMFAPPLPDFAPVEDPGPDDTASPLDRELDHLDELGPAELDAAMRRVRSAMQQRQAQLGSTLGLFLDLRFHTRLGYATAADYVRERLGIPERTARDLIRVVESARTRSPALASAYESGQLPWLRVLTLLPVVRHTNTAAWIQRAREVTVRRLADEVAWAVTRIDFAPEFAAAMPPPPGANLGLDAAADDLDRQMCAQGEPGEGTPHRSHADFFGIRGRFHVSFAAPAPVSALFRTVLQSFAHPTEPRWLAVERMLGQVLAHWRNQPRHPDPVFARDGFRCSAPGCSSYTNLHDHHTVPRSAGGSDDLSNRITLCAWHHLRAVHGGLARASGQAPDAIDWELGLTPEKRPLMRLRGDRYVDPPEDDKPEDE